MKKERKRENKYEYITGEEIVQESYVGMKFNSLCPLKKVGM